MKGFDFLRNYNSYAQGKNIFVKPYSGSDSQSGKTPATAVKTLSRALALATANQNDTVYMFAEGNSASLTTDYQSSTLTWNKDGVHLIGVNAGQRFSQRSRVAFLSSYDTASNLFTVTANGCLIENIEFFAGVAGTSPTGCLQINAGTRNHFKNCHIAGIGNDNNDIDGAYSLFLKGNATENYFEDCVIGCDTISRGTATVAEILTNTSTGVVSGLKPARNVFRGCIITGLCGSAGNYYFLKVNSGGADRFMLFDNCAFINAGSQVGGGAEMTYAMSVASDANGKVVLHNTSITGAADMADNPGNIVSNAPPRATGDPDDLSITWVVTKS